MSTLQWVEIHVVDHCNNNCRSCHNFSPFSPERDYSPEDYFLGLDILERYKLPYTTISLMGGEPFLHPDLAGFARGIRRRYPKREILVTSNGFWLSEQDIIEHDPLWESINAIHFSQYPNIVHMLGGPERYYALLAFLDKRHPHLRVFAPKKNEFRKLWFQDQPMPVSRYCVNSQCTALLPDGRLARCGPGAYMHFKDDLPRAFRESEHMFYDLTKYERYEFAFWRARYPLDACSHCGLSRVERTAWKVESGRPYRKDMVGDYHLELARQRLEAGDHVAAAQRCKRALESGGSQAEAYELLARTCLQLKVPDEAAHYLHLARQAACGESAPPPA